MNSTLQQRMKQLVVEAHAEDRESLEATSEAISVFMDDWDEYVEERWNKTAVEDYSPDHVMKLPRDFEDALPEAQRPAALSALKAATSLLSSALTRTVTAERAAKDEYRQARELLLHLKASVDKRLGGKQK